MGLAVVHSIVEDADGAITVESEPGKGATFRLFFPLARSIAGDLATDRVQEKPLGTERILFVDDEAHICEVARRGLTAFGYEVTALRAPTEALSTFLETPDAFDVLVTDLTMPGMTGLEVAQAVHELRPEIPILLISGFVQPRHAAQGRLVGVREIVSKPISAWELGWAIRRAFGDKGPA